MSSGRETALPIAVRARSFATHGVDASWSEPSRFGAPGILGRRAVERVGRPISSRQAWITDGLAEAIEHLALESASLALPPILDGAEVVDVPTDHGPLFMHRADEVITPQVQAAGVWEPAEERFLLAHLRPGMTFLDVGANVGYFTVVGAQAVGPTGRVAAIEPEPRNLALLRANVWRHSLRNVAVLPMAAGRESGYLHLEVNEANRGDHQVLDSGEGGVLVPAGRLDELLGGLDVDVAKIDTQGADHDVVEGLVGLLRPGTVLLCEYWLEGMERRGVDPRAVIHRYAELGLSFELLTDDGPVATTPDAAVEAAAAWEGRWVNLVLRVP